METPQMSTIDKLMKQLKEEGKVNTLDPYQCQQQSQKIDEKMQAFAQEKQQKLAKDKTEFSTKAF